MTIEPGMPRKVLRKAHDFGVHNDCLISENLCLACRNSVIAAFDHFYGHCKDESEVISAIIDDFRRDMLADLEGEHHA